jgi:Protein of unknown function (DUF3892)
MANRITHIRKPDVNSSHQHITHIKGTRPDGLTFESTVAVVVANLKTGDYSYYVQRDGRTINVTHQKSMAGNEYIKTEPDSTQKDNLLSLPQF